MAHFRIKLALVCSFTANISMLNYVCSKLHPKPNKADTGTFLRGAVFLPGERPCHINADMVFLFHKI